jgi:CBS-domain-containing membrane protein
MQTAAAPGENESLLGARTVVGAALVVLAVAALNQHFWTVQGAPLLVTPIGASAVAVLSSPRPVKSWAILAGVSVSAVSGVLSAQLAPPLVACPLAVGVALVLMARLRCVHVPSVAVALSAVVGGPGIHRQGLGFLFCPVLLDWVTLLLVCGLLRRVWERDWTLERFLGTEGGLARHWRRATSPFAKAEGQTARRSRLSPNPQRSSQRQS